MIIVTVIHHILIHSDTIQDHSHLVSANSFILFAISFSSQNGINKYLSVRLEIRFSLC